MFYRIDSARLTLREYAWNSPILMLPLLMLFKLLRIRLQMPAAIPDSIEPFRAEPEAIPEEIRAKIQPLEEQMSACGFVDPAYHWICDPYGSRRLCMVTFRHLSGSTIGQISFISVGLRNAQKESLHSAFITSYQDETYFVSTNRRKEMIGTPTHQVQRRVGALLPELWNAHCQEVSLKSFGKTILTVRSREEMLALAEKEEAESVQCQIQRGVLVPYGETEQKAIEAVMTSSGSEADRAFAAIYDEINRLINQKVSWGSVILVLIISAVVFFAMGNNERSWESIALVAGVLFFHELGHLTTMWLFRYRNLRMFFIPFLGAAVSGQNYNVPGWKKAIVSLMGPVPGIFLGGVLGILGAMYQWQTMWFAAFMLLGINLFNLLPIIPLDGGQAMHAVLFSRHPILDAVFRTVAAILMVLSGLAGMRILMAVGIGMLLGLPQSYRVAKVVHRLRRSGFDANSPDSQTIPLETAHTLYQELREVLPKNANAKTSAQLTLNVFELLNAKPPGWLASLALLGIHGFSFLAVGVIILAMAIIQRGGFQGMNLPRLMGEHQKAIDCHKVQHWEGPNAKPADDAEVNTLVADFSSVKKAEETYRELTAKLPPCATATLFGQTVMVTLPAEDDKLREQWLGELDQRSKDVFVQNKDVPKTFLLTCTAPDGKTAEKLVEEIKAYTNIPFAMHPVPPWSPEHLITDRDLKARRTYAALQDTTDEFNDPRWTSHTKKLRQAVRRGDTKVIEQLNKEGDQIQKDIHKESIQKMRKEGNQKWDIALLDRYEKTPEPGFDDIEGDEEIDADNPKVGVALKKRQDELAQWQIEFGSHLGQVALEGGKPRAGSNRFSVAYGHAFCTGTTLQINAALVQPAFGAPALLKWLAKRGCTEMKYEFLSPTDEFEN